MSTLKIFLEEGVFNFITDNIKGDDNENIISNHIEKINNDGIIRYRDLIINKNETLLSNIGHKFVKTYTGSRYVYEECNMKKHGIRMGTEIRWTFDSEIISIIFNHFAEMIDFTYDKRMCKPINVFIISQFDDIIIVRCTIFKREKNGRYEIFGNWLFGDDTYSSEIEILYI